jgi:hypothetical protein
MSNINEFSPEVKQAWAEVVATKDRQKVAEIITEFVQPNHYTNTYMNLLLDTRALTAGDLLRKKMRKGIEVRTLVPGAVHLASEITVNEWMNFNLDGADVKVHYNEWELERGDIGSLAEIRTEMRAKLADYYFKKIFTALSTVWSASNTPNNFTNVGGPITASALEDAIDEINYRGGGVKAVVGTRRALAPITKFGAFWDNGAPSASAPAAPIQSALEEVRRTGWIGRYYGADIVGLDQIWDNPYDNNALLPEDTILVVGQRVGEFITYGDVRTKAWTDNNPTPPEFYIELYQQFGMIIDNAQGIYVIKVTNS